MSETTVAAKTPLATIKQVADYFGRKPMQTLKEWGEEWKQLSEEEKTQIREGLGNGTMTY